MADKMNRTRVLFHICKRNISSTSILHKHIMRYKNIFEENPKSVRTDFQRLFDAAKGKIPFDKRYPITGKNVGPSVDGGSKEAQERAAVHLVQTCGYISKTGRFIKVKAMVPEFIVPDLEKFPLKPYVSYKATEVIQSKMTAKDLFNACYADDIAKQIEPKREAGKKALESKKSIRGLIPRFNIRKKGSQNTN